MNFPVKRSKKRIMANYNMSTVKQTKGSYFMYVSNFANVLCYFSTPQRVPECANWFTCTLCRAEIECCKMGISRRCTKSMCFQQGLFRAVLVEGAFHCRRSLLNVCCGRQRRLARESSKRTEKLEMSRK